MEKELVSDWLITAKIVPPNSFIDSPLPLCSTDMCTTPLLTQWLTIKFRTNCGCEDAHLANKTEFDVRRSGPTLVVKLLTLLTRLSLIQAIRTISGSKIAHLTNKTESDARLSGPTLVEHLANKTEFDVWLSGPSLVDQMPTLLTRLNLMLDYYHQPW